MRLEKLDSLTLEDLDLFNHLELVPQEVLDIISTFNEDEDVYVECERVIKSLNRLGYTSSYGLSGELYNLRKLK